MEVWPNVYNLLIFFLSVFHCLFSYNKKNLTPPTTLHPPDLPPKSRVRTTNLLMLNIPITTPRLANRKLWPCGQHPTWSLGSSSPPASDLDLLDLAGDLLDLLTGPGVPPLLPPPPDLLLWLLLLLLLLWRPPLPAALRLLQQIIVNSEQSTVRPLNDWFETWENERKLLLLLCWVTRQNTGWSTTNHYRMAPYSGAERFFIDNFWSR